MLTGLFKGLRRNRDLGVSRRRKALGWSHIEGGLWAAMVGCSETFAVYYAVKRGLNENELAFISTLPILMGAFFSWWIPRFIHQSILKIALLVSVFIQILGILGLLLSINRDHHFWWILVSLILYMSGGLLAGPLWIDWMTPWLPDEKISRYLSRRNGFTALITVCSYLLAAYLIHKDESPQAYQIVFVVALMCRLLSWLLLLLQPSPSGETPTMSSKIFPHRSFLSSWPIILVFLATPLFRFVQNFASPFFLPYMIHDLHFNLLDYAWITAVPFLARAFFLAQWGEAVRTYRPYVALQTGMILLGFVCLAWTWFNDLFLLTVTETFSGIAWGGFELSVILIMHNFIPGRARTLIGFNLATQHLASVGGALVGAKLLESQWTYHEIFNLSGFSRLLISALFIFATLRMKETKVALRVYGEFFITAMSLRHQFTALARFIPGSIKNIKTPKPPTPPKV